MEWMAWTWPTAIFFGVIATLLITFTVLAIKFPETPRVGVLRIETTRGGPALYHAARLSFYQYRMARPDRHRPVVGAGGLCRLRRIGL